LKDDARAASPRRKYWHVGGHSASYLLTASQNDMTEIDTQLTKKAVVSFDLTNKWSIVSEGTNIVHPPGAMTMGIHRNDAYLIGDKKFQVNPRAQSAYVKISVLPDL